MNHHLIDAASSHRAVRLAIIIVALAAAAGNAQVSQASSSAAAPADTVTRRPERIAGRVTTDSGVPIRRAVVSVTRA